MTTLKETYIQINELHEIKAKITELTLEEKRIKIMLTQFIKDKKKKNPKHDGKLETMYGKITLSERRKYFYSEDVDEIAEELKAQKKSEEETAISRDEWLEKDRPAIAIYDITDVLTVREAKKDK